MGEGIGNISDLISELVSYAVKAHLIKKDDVIYSTNRLLELFGEVEYRPEQTAKKPRDLHYILEDMTDIAVQNGILENDTITNRDMFDTKIMGLITPPPSVVRKKFMKKYEISPKEATDYY